MQGPYDVKTVSFNEENNELLWLTAYSSEIINSENEQILSDDFMCHNNLEIADKNSFPWHVKTIGTNIRLFTLTEGQTKVEMPSGYGIPFPASEKTSLYSQVLNHNIQIPHLVVKHRVNIEYCLLVKRFEWSNKIGLSDVFNVYTMFDDQVRVLYVVV